MAQLDEQANYRDVKRLLELSEEIGLPEAKTNKLVKVVGATGDKTLAEDLERSLTMLGSKRLSDPYRKGKNYCGSFNIGTTDDGKRINLKRSELNKNLLVVGETGSGKTNLFYHLAGQLMDQGLPVLALDFKQDYRHLDQLRDDVLVLRWEDFKFNPLRPPRGVSPSRWLQVFTNTFSDSQGFLTASKYFLMTRIHRLYELYGIFEGKEKYPSFQELAEVLRYEKQPLVTKQARYLETTINRVEAISLTIGEMLDCSKGLPLEKLLEKNVVIELDGLAEEIQQFLVETILVWIYFYRVSQGDRGKLRHCILFDEARKVFDRNKELSHESGIPIIDYITAKTREFGEALIVGDQELSKLTDSIKANTHSVLGLPLGSGKDIEELSEVMGLTERQRNRLYKLNVGQGVFKKSGEDPVKVKTPLVEVEKSLTTSQLRESNREAINELREEVVERCRPERFQDYLQKLAGKHKVKDKSIKKGEPKQEGKISSQAESLLVDIAESPFKQLSDRYEDLSFSSYKGNKTRKELVGKRYVKEVEINLGAGGRPKFFELTEKGEKAYEEIKPDEVYAVKGGGSLEHRFWQQKIGEHFQDKFYETYIEFVLDDSQLDVFAVSSSGEKIGIEVALSPGGEMENIKKDLKLDLDEIIVACKNERVMSQVGKKARNELREKIKEVRFCPVMDFT